MKSIHLRLHDSQLAKLEELAQAQERSVAYLARKAIKAFIENERLPAATSGDKRDIGVAPTP